MKFIGKYVTVKTQYSVLRIWLHFFRDECSRHQSYQLSENYIDFKHPVKMFDTRDVVKMKEVYVFDV